MSVEPHDGVLMDDQRFGMAVRTARVRQRKRQEDLAILAKVARSTISRIEHGMVDSVSLRTLRRVCAALDVRVELIPRSRGADLERMLGARHAQLAESVIRTLRQDSSSWQILPEVSFSIWGERGVVDILAWHPGRRALLIIELKTEIVDVGEMLGTLDRKRRLGRDIAALHHWDPETVSAWLIVAGGRTNERRIAEFRSTLRTAYPDDGRRMRSWLIDPVGTVAGLSLWSPKAVESVRMAPVARVHRPGLVRRSGHDSAKRPPEGR